MDALLQLDQQLFQLLNGTWHHPWLDVLLPLWRNKYTWFPFYAAALGWLLYRFGRQGLWWALVAALTVGASDYTSSTLLKKNIGRLRPCKQAEVRLLVPCGGAYSFPSSHAANHFAMACFAALTLGRRYRRIRIPLLLWAAVVAWAQVYVGVHFPGDVSFGALLGSLIGWGAARAALRMAPDSPLFGPRAENRLGA
ncbi:MAG: phosphatase PAP2 family protein [Bacteroidetes bacterium]|nr:MAG: phosphatase PAP2 family protein [Bacteroidota bacterium]